MGRIPDEAAVVLAGMGIVGAEEARWKRQDSWPRRRVRAHCYCECDGGRVELLYAVLARRAVFVGQCGKCKVVHWREAVSEG